MQALPCHFDAGYESQAFHSDDRSNSYSPLETRLFYAVQELIDAAQALRLNITLEQWVERRAPSQLNAWLNLCNNNPYRDPDQNIRKRKASEVDNASANDKSAVDHTEFWTGLPANYLTDAEADLREALLDFLHRRMRDDPSMPPAISEIASKKGDARVFRCKVEVLPMSIPFRDWIERRISDEVTAFWDPDRRCTAVRLAQGEECLSKVQRSKPADIPSDVSKQHNDRRGSKPKIQKVKSAWEQQRIDRFIQSLPSNEHTTDELRLREALLDFIGKHEEANPGYPPRISDANGKKEGDSAVRARSQFLPQGVGLGDWVEARMGIELVVAWDHWRECSVFMRADAACDADGRD